MKFQTVTEGDELTYVVVLDEGEEAVEALTSFARDQRLAAAQLTAVGAFSGAVLGWFDRQTQECRRNRIDEQCEVLSVLGDVALDDGQSALHIHCVVGLSDGTTRGGHLLEGYVSPTLETVVRESPAQLRKTMRPEIGLALIDIGQSDS